MTMTGVRRTITISRQMGSLGCEIARAAGELLGYQVFQREIINDAARRAGAPEAALAVIDELGLLGLCPSPELCAAYRQAVDQVMKELVEHGNVIIIGRAGQVILAGLPQVFHVRVLAPAPLRARRISERHGIHFDGAKALISASDRFRKNYIKRFYSVDWTDPDLYDLVLNTARIEPDGAARLIALALAEPTILRQSL